MAEIIETTTQNAIAYPQDARQAAQDAIARYLAMLRTWTLTRRGVAGDGVGGVDVTGRTNFVYARLGAADGEVVEAHSPLVTPTEDALILIQRDTGGAIGQWRLVGLG